MFKSKKRIIISIIVVVYLIACIPMLYYVLYAKKISQNNQRFFDKMVEMAIPYLEENYDLPFDCYNITTDGADNVLISQNFLNPNEKYIYPYSKTDIFFLNTEKNIKVVVHFQKKETGELYISGHDRIE